LPRSSVRRPGWSSSSCRCLPDRRSPDAGLGDTQARTRTGASIVAVIRGGVAAVSPGPAFVLIAGDLLVTVGTREGVDQVVRILEGTYRLS
jgi:TrkA domain protein